MLGTHCARRATGSHGMHCPRSGSRGSHPSRRTATATATPAAPAAAPVGRRFTAASIRHGMPAGRCAPPGRQAARLRALQARSYTARPGRPRCARRATPNFYTLWHSDRFTGDISLRPRGAREAVSPLRNGCHTRVEHSSPAATHRTHHSATTPTEQSHATSINENYRYPCTIILW